MKKFLLFGIVSLFYSLYSYSQADGLLIAENFPYNNGNLTGQGNSPAWTSSGGSGDVVVTALSNNTGALVYPGYSSGTSYITTNNSNTKDPYKGFIGSQTVSTANATTFYLSFVVRVTSSSNTSTTSLAFPSVALRTSLGGNVCYFYVADNGFGTQHLKFGISKTGGLGNGTYASGDFLFNTTYLIVIRYDIVTGSTTNDKMYMWVNPSLNSEPVTASADQAITTGSDGSATGNITALQLLEDNFFDGTTADFDAFKVAYARGYTGSPSNPNVAWSDLDPVGAPLPVKFGNLKASQQSNTVRLDWSSYSEENVHHYEIQRSPDGRSFTQIGQLAAAGHSTARIDYNWLDVSPDNGNNFYRIKSVDIDGRIIYSSIVKISLGNTNNTRIGLYPNPVKGSEIAVQLKNLQKGNYSVQVFNNMGQQLSQLQINLANENTTQTIQLPPGIKPGTYSLRITNGVVKFNQIFIVK